MKKDGEAREGKENVNRFDQADVGKLLFGCRSSALLTDPLRRLFFVSFAPQSLVIATRLISYPPPSHPPTALPPRPSQPSWGAEEGSGMSLR
ncbi:hypothetical protein PAMP_009946 [Pampus punctatissimus]